MGPITRTFATDAERVAYVAGYLDAIGATCEALRLTGLAAGTATDPGPAIQGAFNAMAKSLETHAKEVL